MIRLAALVFLCVLPTACLAGEQELTANSPPKCVSSCITKLRADCLRICRANGGPCPCEQGAVHTRRLCEGYCIPLALRPALPPLPTPDPCEFSRPSQEQLENPDLADVPTPSPECLRSLRPSN